VRKDGEEIWETLGDEFFSFFLKNIDGEGIWGTLGDALMPNDPGHVYFLHKHKNKGIQIKII
jgi:hypothetical protein